MHAHWTGTFQPWIWHATVWLCCCIYSYDFHALCDVLLHLNRITNFLLYFSYIKDLAWNKYVEKIKLREFLEPAWTLLGNLPFIPDHVLLLTKPHTSYCEGAKWVQCSTPNQKVVNSILTHGSFLVRDGVCCNPGRAVQYQSLSSG